MNTVPVTIEIMPLEYLQFVHFEEKKITESLHKSVKFLKIKIMIII